VSDPTLLPLFRALPGASFIVNGEPPTLTSVGVELRLANGITLLAKFDGEFASHSSTYAGTGTIGKLRAPRLPRPSCIFAPREAVKSHWSTLHEGPSNQSNRTCGRASIRCQRCKWQLF
jgi:hypothetical protein